MKHEKSKNDAMRHELDHIDAKILNLLRENARMPLKEIAEHVFLSSPAVSARIERLEKEGYITGYQVKLNPALLGYPIKAFINLEVEPVQKKEFYPYIEKVHNVVECNCVTGDYSMLIEGLFVSTIELDQFIGELQHFGQTQKKMGRLPECSKVLSKWRAPLYPPLTVMRSGHLIPLPGWNRLRKGALLFWKQCGNR